MNATLFQTLPVRLDSGNHLAQVWRRHGRHLHQLHDTLPNLKCDFDAALDRVAVREIEKHLALSDKGWEESGYSDDAYGVPFRLSNVRPGLPAA